MSIQRVVPRPIAAVLEQMPARDVSTHFRPLLDQVYAAATTHWGDYRLGEAHDAVVTWCRTTGHTLAGISWEVYGHWHDDPTKIRTDIFYLLRPAAD